MTSPPQTSPTLRPKRDASPLRHRLYVVIFESETRAGRAFDVALIIAILASVVVVMLDSIPTLEEDTKALLRALEWAFTIAFTIEYVLRLWVVDRPLRYARSFFGLVDLFAILPTYMALLLPGAQYLLVIRVLRVLRIFRVLKLAHFIGEGQLLGRAMVASRHKITIFLLSVLTAVVIFGSLLYLIEGADSGFDSIPRSVYWAIVTLTTVGYGDIAPQTPLGQAVSAIIMLLGYGMIAVPTGIMTVELGNAARAAPDTTPTGAPTGASEAAREGGSGPGSEGDRTCRTCGRTERDPEARFCRYCGTALSGTQ